METSNIDVMACGAGPNSRMLYLLKEDLCTAEHSVFEVVIALPVDSLPRTVVYVEGHKKSCG